MTNYISLEDIDGPGKPLFAEIEERSETVLELRIPETRIRFYLHRQEGQSHFDGCLSGRRFVFNPSHRRNSGVVDSTRTRHAR